MKTKKTTKKGKQPGVDDGSAGGRGKKKKPGAQKKHKVRSAERAAKATGYSASTLTNVAVVEAATPARMTRARLLSRRRRWHQS